MFVLVQARALIRIGEDLRIAWSIIDIGCHGNDRSFNIGESEIFLTTLRERELSSTCLLAEKARDESEHGNSICTAFVSCRSR